MISEEDQCLIESLIQDRKELDANQYSQLILEYTQKIKYFKKLNRDHRQNHVNLCNELKLVKYKRGEHIYKKEEHAEGVFIVLNGKCVSLVEKNSVQLYEEQLQNKQRIETQNSDDNDMNFIVQSQNIGVSQDQFINIVINNQTVDRIYNREIKNYYDYYKKGVFLYLFKQVYESGSDFGTLEMVKKIQRQQTILCLEDASLILIDRSGFKVSVLMILVLRILEERLDLEILAVHIELDFKAIFGCK